MVKLKDLNQQIDVSYERQAHHHTTNYNYRQWANHQRSALKFLTFLQSIHSETKKEIQIFILQPPQRLIQTTNTECRKKRPPPVQIALLCLYTQQIFTKYRPPTLPPKLFYLVDANTPNVTTKYVHTIFTIIWMR